MTFSEAIKKIRTERCLSQENFAKDIGVAFSTVNRWENKRSKPNYMTLKILNDYCKRYSIDVSVTEVED